MDIFENYLMPLFTCKKCDVKVIEPTRDGYGEVECACCGGELEFVESRRPTYVTVAVYETTRAYGGAEEGGWYYNEGYRICGTARSFLAEDAMQMEVYREAMLHRYAHDPAYKMWDTARYTVRAWAETDAPLHFPEVTPRYC